VSNDGEAKGLACAENDARREVELRVLCARRFQTQTADKLIYINSEEYWLKKIDTEVK